MSGEFFNWHEFLGRWQAEWVPRADRDGNGGQTVVPLGRPGADEAAIAAAEERLGRRLPPSYREFLAVSDGWHVDQMAGVYRLGGAADIDWFRDPYDMTPLYEEHLDDNPREEDVLLAGMWQRALRLETDSDMSYALLDPGDSDQDGEGRSTSTRAGAVNCRTVTRRSARTWRPCTAASTATGRRDPTS